MVESIIQAIEALLNDAANIMVDISDILMENMVIVITYDTVIMNAREVVTCILTEEFELRSENYSGG